MHGNEPVLIAFIGWRALVVFAAVRSFVFWSRPGPLRDLRVVYFFAALPWLAIWMPALIGCAFLWLSGKYPIPTLTQLVERFSGSSFDVGLGIYALSVPVLFPGVAWFAIRARNAGNVS